MNVRCNMATSLGSLRKESFSPKMAQVLVSLAPATFNLLFIAGQDSGPKRWVLELVGSLGFRPIDAGPLVMGRALEGMGLLNINLNMRDGWSWQSGWKLFGPTGEGVITGG